MLFLLKSSIIGRTDKTCSVFSVLLERAFLSSVNFLQKAIKFFNKLVDKLIREKNWVLTKLYTSSSKPNIFI